MQLALREALYCGAGITKQHAAGAVTVQQFAHQTGAGFSIPGVDFRQQGIAFGAEETVNGLLGFWLQAALVQQLLHSLGYRAIVFAFSTESRQIVEAVWVKQAQTGKVAVLAQLFGGCCQ